MKLLSWIFSLWDTFVRNTTLTGWLHTLSTLIFPLVSSNYWNHVWWFKTVSVTTGGQVYASHEGTLVSQWDASFRPGGGELDWWKNRCDGILILRGGLLICVSVSEPTTPRVVTQFLSACLPIIRQGQGCSAAVPSPPLNTLIPKSLLTLWRHKSPAIISNPVKHHKLTQDFHPCSE